jgi:hypothetical protein
VLSHHRCSAGCNELDWLTAAAVRGGVAFATLGRREPFAPQLLNRQVLENPVFDFVQIDEHRIVLGPPREDLDGAADLFVAADALGNEDDTVGVILVA